MPILRGDKIVLIKAYDKINQIGATFEVADITTNGLVIIRDNKTKVAVGAIEADQLFKHFEKQEDIKNKWTEWNRMLDPFGATIGFYRTNFKKVQVKIPNKEVKIPKKELVYCKAEACCNLNEDDFNIGFGVNLAYLRCLNKALEDKMNDIQNEIIPLTKNINQIQDEIINNERTIKKMISLLDKKKQESGEQDVEEQMA